MPKSKRTLQNYRLNTKALQIGSHYHLKCCFYCSIMLKHTEIVLRGKNSCLITTPLHEDKSFLLWVILRENTVYKDSGTLLSAFVTHKTRSCHKTNL